MGVPGMILAPVVLHYLKMEAAQIEVTRGTEELVPTSKNGPGGFDRSLDPKE